MERKVKFALLQYIPNNDRDERINVAVVLHSPQDEFLETKLINNIKRVKEFDDEIDTAFIKQYLKSIQEEFTYNIANSNILINDFLLLNEMTKFYVNQFVFKLYESVIDISCNDYLEEIRKQFLYFDIEKRKRPSTKDSLDFFTKILKSKNINYELINAKNSLIGDYNENINVEIKLRDTYYKFINFTDSNVDTYMSIIKMWLFNAIELKELNKRLVFVVNGDMANEKVSMFIKMLKKYGEVIGLEDVNNIK